MPIKTIRFYTLALIVADAAAILLAFALAYTFRVVIDHRPLITQISALEFAKTFLLLTPCWLVAFWAIGLYSPRVYRRRLAEYGRVILGSISGILIVLGYSFVTNTTVFPARLVAVYSFVLVLVLLVAARELVRQLSRIAFFYGRGVNNVMIVGNGTVTADMIAELSDTRRSGIRVVAVLNTSRKEYRASGFAIAHLHSLKTAADMLKKLHVNTIIQTELYEDSARNLAILAMAQNAHAAYSFIPGESEFYSGKNDIDVWLGYPIIHIYQTPLIGWGAVAKRIFDLLFLLIFLPIWGVVFLILILLQKIFNPGPVLFSQQRIGQNGRPFHFYKFRSMNPKYSGQDAIAIFRDMGRDDLAKEYAKTRKIRNDPRITPFGRILRKTSLDELGQIINVIRGDMSLVGPRPILPDELEFYRERGPLLLSVKPGLTGLWQVSGRSSLPFAKRVDLELYYAQNWSFWLDVKILFKTIRAVFSRDEAE